MNLKHNVWFFTDGFDKKTCNNIIKNIKKFESKKGKVGGTDNQTELKISTNYQFRLIKI